MPKLSFSYPYQQSQENDLKYCSNEPVFYFKMKQKCYYGEQIFYNQPGFEPKALSNIFDKTIIASEPEMKISNKKANKEHHTNIITQRQSKTNGFFCLTQSQYVQQKKPSTKQN